MDDYPRPWIAIVGRPNVGKSTLFNRLIGRRKAVVSATTGTTRDRLYGTIEWRGRTLTLIDTGGFDVARTQGVNQAVQRHVHRALQEADVALVVCDAQAGLLPADQMIMERVRAAGKPIVLSVNKADHRLVVPPEFFALGVAPVQAVSALHGRGTAELLEQLIAPCAASAPGTSSASASAAAGSAGSSFSVALVGRQNVGKSSLLNALLREERAIVNEWPGTTRDAVEGWRIIDGSAVRLIDTAGLRHRRKAKEPVDIFSMSRSVEAIRRADVALVVLDATQGMTRDDQRIIGLVTQAGCGWIVVVNKWDLVKGTPLRRLTTALHAAASATATTTVVAVSAKTGFGVARLVPAARRVWQAMRRHLTDEHCTRIFRQAWEAHPPPRWRGRVIRLRAAQWLPGRPVRIELHVAPVGWLPHSYQQYLLKRLYADEALLGVPIQLFLNTVGVGAHAP